MTPIALALGRMSLIRQAALVAGGTVVLALSAQASVPFLPVPMTLQTLAILAVGLTLGSRLGVATVLAWYAQAAMGLPVLANFGTAANFAGPTGGFLVGFVAMVWIAGLAADRGVTGVARLSAVTLLASAVIYLPGLAWPLGLAQAAGIDAGWAGLPAASVLSAFAWPFLPGDAVKAVLAAVLATGGGAWLARRGA